MSVLSRRLKTIALANFALAAIVVARAEDAATEAPPVVSPTSEENRYTTTREMKDDTILTQLFLERLHLTQKKVADIDMDALIESFFETLDPSHSIFLQTDLTSMQKRFAPSLEYFLMNGNLNCAFKIYEEFEKRLGERIDWAEKRLQEPFDLNGKGTFKINRKEEKFPQTTEEANAIWEGRLTNDVINELLSAKSTDSDEMGIADYDSDEAEVESGDNDEESSPDLSPEARKAAQEKILKRYQKLRKNLTLEPWEIEELFLNSLTAQFDPHTTFFSAQSMEDFQISMRNSLCGIGALLTDDDGYCTIREILAGGPVERSGKFSVGDRIIAVGTGDDDSASLTDVIGMRLNRVVRMLRGKKGEKVRLLVESANDHSIRKYITLERDDIKLTEQLATANVFYVPATNGAGEIPVGVVDLPSFYGKDRSDNMAFSTAEDVKELLAKLKALGIKALILDLRTNGGGYLNEAIDLTELFVGPGQNVLQVKGTGSKADVLPTGSHNILTAISNRLAPADPDWTGPLIVLVSKASASASEIVAGALRDNKRAIIVGDPSTHGKGSVQEVMPYERFADGQKASIKITRSKWYSPSGNSIQLKGVSADIAIPSVYSVLPIAESDLKNPLPWDSIPSSLPKNQETPKWLTAPISKELIARLAEDSKTRQAELPEFITLSRTISWFDEREKDKSVPLNINERLEIRNSDKALNEFIKKEYAELQKSDFRQTEVKLDSAIAQEKESGENKSILARKANVPLPGATTKKVSEKDESPNYDVILRETVRIAADWVNVLDEEKAAKEAAEAVRAAKAAKASAAEKKAAQKDAATKASPADKGKNAAPEKTSEK